MTALTEKAGTGTTHPDPVSAHLPGARCQVPGGYEARCAGVYPLPAYGDASGDNRKTQAHPTYFSARSSVAKVKSSRFRSVPTNQLQSAAPIELSPSKVMVGPPDFRRTRSPGFRSFSFINLLR